MLRRSLGGKRRRQAVKEGPNGGGLRAGLQGGAAGRKEREESHRIRIRVLADLFLRLVEWER